VEMHFAASDSPRSQSPEIPVFPGKSTPFR